MNIRSILPQKAFLPVIHVVSTAQCIENVQKARDAGADGAFLISHNGIPAGDLVEMHYQCRDLIPVREKFFLGCNFLDLNNMQALGIAQENMQGLWLDDGLHRLDAMLAGRLQEKRERVGFAGALFGGVAFKYRTLMLRRHEKLGDLCRLATTCMDVITTSGPGTGSPPDVTKIRTMREAIGDFPLAIASGIDEDNVGMFLPLADYFVVASSISRIFHELDPILTRRLADLIHAF